MVICLERCAEMPLPLTVSCFSKIQIGFTFLVPAHLGSPGQRAVKRVCVLMGKYQRKKEKIKGKKMGGNARGEVRDWKEREGRKARVAREEK